MRRVLTPARAALALILVGGLAVRLWNIDYGLPFVWSLDEGSHFTSRAVAMFRDGLNPEYFQNPTLFTYLVYGLLRVAYGPLGFLFDLPFGNVTEQFERDPERIWVTARGLAATLCVAGVAATYWAGRRLWGAREGLVAAAVLSFSFLPVAYSRVAVSDVGALIGVALSLVGAVRAYEEGRRADYLLAGAGAGLALSFKYTAGLLLLPLAIAALARLRRDRGAAVLNLGLGVGLAAVVLVVLNPYLLLDFDQFSSEVRGQVEVTADLPKPGQEGGGVSYYLDSLTWGLGWAAALAALGGAAIELRRDVVRGLILISLPLALLAYLSLQARFFGRWLLPAYPALALLAGVALTQLAELLPSGARARAAVLAGLTAAVLAQPLAADLRSGAVLGRKDTREQARDFLAARYPPELRASIEPAVPGRWYRLDPDGDGPPSAKDSGQFTRPDGGVRASAYHFVVSQAVIDEYRRSGYCVIVTMSVVRERALSTGSERVRGYYRRLKRESRLLRAFSPYEAGAKPVDFHFDLSYNYYPTAYARPGPEVRVYRLDRCRQRYGAPAVRIPRAVEAEDLPP